MAMNPSRKLSKAFVSIMNVSKWEAVVIVWRSRTPSPRGMRVILPKVIQLPFVHWEVPVVLVIVYWRFRGLGGVVLFLIIPQTFLNGM